jgi:predicted enzyme related to lactoylglutathione lyase
VAENVIVWADIPVTDMDRARKFYRQVLGTEVPVMPGTDDQVALLMAPGQVPGQGGEMLVSADLAVMGKPSMDGATVYLNSYGDIAGMVARVREAGGEVLQEPQDMGPMVGTIAFIKDSEGNRIGIQQPNPQK